MSRERVAANVARLRDLAERRLREGPPAGLAFESVEPSAAGFGPGTPYLFLCRFRTAAGTPVCGGVTVDAAADPLDLELLAAWLVETVREGVAPHATIVPGAAKWSPGQAPAT